MVPTVERGLRLVDFWSMETAGDRPSMKSTAGLSIWPRNWRAYAESDSTYLRRPSAKIVSKASDDFPEPDSPVNTIIESRGSSRETFFKLCSRAPRITRRSAIVLRAWPRDRPGRRCASSFLVEGVRSDHGGAYRETSCTAAPTGTTGRAAPCEHAAAPPPELRPQQPRGVRPHSGWDPILWVRLFDFRVSREAARSLAGRDIAGTSLQLPHIAAGLDHTRDDRDGHHAEDDAQRQAGTDLGDVDPVLVEGMQEHLDADDHHDRGEAPADVGQPVHQPGQQEVQDPQPEQRESVRGEHEVGVLGEPEDRWDRVDREDQVGDTDRDDHHEHRGDVTSSVEFHGQPRAVVAVAYRPHLPEHAHSETVGVVGLLFLRACDAVPDDLDRRVDEQRAEQVEDFAPRVDRLRPDRDEHAAHDQRQHDADQQHLMLVLL